MATVTREAVLKALERVNDPEINLNIVDLGLVYGVEIDPENRVHVKMSLTAPGCPAAGFIMEQARQAVLDVEGVLDADVELVWEPRWTQEMMSERLKKMLRMGITRM